MRLFDHRILCLYAPWASEKEWHPKQKLIPRKNGALELHIPVADTRDIESWILSLGEHVRVLGPVGLRRRIVMRHSVAARYKKTNYMDF